MCDQRINYFGPLDVEHVIQIAFLELVEHFANKTLLFSKLWFCTLPLPPCFFLTLVPKSEYNDCGSSRSCTSSSPAGAKEYRDRHRRSFPHPFSLVAAIESCGRWLPIFSSQIPIFWRFIILVLELKQSIHVA
jgi:hypothetical protein